MKSLAFVLTVIITSSLFSVIVPYPTGSKLLSASEQQYINDLNETEVKIEAAITIVPVLNLDWFEYMNTYFTKYKTIRVIDVHSLTEYYVQRLGGSNHADVQTVDAKNTAIFKQIYGGTWSWTRRPVWVEIAGKYYAGSSNGMPHGFDILKTGEGGHTCIHFLNSKTHGTKRVDEAHQAAIKYAYEHQDLLNTYLNM